MAWGALTVGWYVANFPWQIVISSLFSSHDFCQSATSEVFSGTIAKSD
jgi:hypothetical protein